MKTSPPRPPRERHDLRCPDCGQSMHLRWTPKFGGRWFYGCTGWPSCTTCHGAHRDGAPLGVPASKDVRQARQAAHLAFDQLWKSDLMSRSDAYAWLTAAMKLDKPAHIGEMNADDCARVIALSEDALARSVGADEWWKT